MFNESIGDIARHEQEERTARRPARHCKGRRRASAFRQQAPQAQLYRAHCHVCLLSIDVQLPTASSDFSGLRITKCLRLLINTALKPLATVGLRGAHAHRSRETVIC
mgnify:CR=1 FL=1